MRAALIVAGLCAASLPVAAEEPVFSATVHALATAIGPGTDSNAAKIPLTIRMRGDETRIDFTGPGGEQAHLIGRGGFAGSSVVKLAIDSNADTPYDSLEDAWKSWNKSQSVVNQGWINRRNAKWNIYTDGVYEHW